jgi:hypothetical protein
VFYRWEISRAAACLDHIIPVAFTGTIRCDGYAAYRSFANGRNGTIGLAGCWSHVRRKFHEALEQSPKTTGWIMRQIQHHYRVEARLRQHQAGPKLREAVRAHESKPIVARLERALIRLKSSGRHLPQNLLGQWRTLDVYLGDGRVEIDKDLFSYCSRFVRLHINRFFSRRRPLPAFNFGDGRLRRPPIHLVVPFATAKSLQQPFAAPLIHPMRIFFN